jgi:ribonucleoside-diphosphate reductase beta chain
MSDTPGFTVFDATQRTDHTKALPFLDPNGGVAIQRYETMRHRVFDGLTEKQLGFFWRPQEVDTVKDGADFKMLSEAEQHIFTSNLKRQILLDSVQGRSPNIAFLPIVSLPELEGFITVWAFSESIHSRSYTHIIRNVYSDPSVVFDEMMDIEQIVDCAKDISEGYDTLIRLTQAYQLHGEGAHEINSWRTEFTIEDAEQDDGTGTLVQVKKIVTKRVPDSKQILVVDLYELKKALWKAIVSVNILEGVRFYVSFACSWAFGEQKKMEGNAKIIKLICRDENLHLAATQTLLKILPKDDPDFIKIREETHDECVKLFKDAVDQEKEWARYLFKDGGSMIGLNYELLANYVEFIADKRLARAGYPTLYNAKTNPLPWTEAWIAGQDVQVAPQETEITSYQIGGTKQDVNKDTFGGFDLG